MRAPPVVSLFYLTGVTAQLHNGQYFSRGLSIVDAPNPGSPYRAGSNMPIAVDVSGNGQLSAHKDTSIDELHIYLVSAQTNANFSVAADDAFLSGEEGSTVKHLDFIAPECVPAGSYNLTFYEVSTYQGQSYFAITPLPVEIQSQSKDVTCTAEQPTTPEPQPQPDAALVNSPFLPGNTSPPNIGMRRSAWQASALFLSSSFVVLAV
ncbi:hypothetical protein AURDEDRAFT_163313 [Auricularia subglabra TFB-10046 SS5]|nr:hypothetical protein AURDEDRAFT_163313 [Auricularia subglabra TFB-10046 SS5]